MNKKIKLAVMLSTITSTALFATNGDNLIGVGAKTRAMGGAGIALTQGAESTLVNPAAITKVQSNQISFGGTIFAPSIKTQMGMGNESKSSADLSIIPAVAIASKYSDSIYMGIGMYGTAGMGTDFRSNPSLFKMETTLQLMQFAVPVAYRAGAFSVGVAPILQYGSLDIHYQLPAMMGGANVGNGQTQDFGFGVDIGANYDINSNFSIGAVYKSKIKMKYDGALSTATTPFVAMGAFPAAMGDTLEQPAEVGVGVAYKNGAHTIALDYKKVMWSKAKGYKGFGWSDQSIFALGYEYNAGTWALRAGYNYAKSPLKLLNGTTPSGAVLNMFNVLGFPATAKQHFTFGGSYQFNKNLSVDAAVVYATSSKTTADISGIFGPGAKISNKHSETGLTVQFNYKF